MSMQIVVEIENIQAKATNIRKAKKRWKRREKIYDCKKQTILMRCFKQIDFEEVESLD